VNREQKRMMAKQGASPEGTTTARRAPAATPQRRAPKQRTGIRQFFREVREEMRQVAWPTRPELINYTTITLFVLVLMTSLIFGLNYVFGKFVLWLFQK